MVATPHHRSTTTNGWLLLLGYVACGALHELSHVAVARYRYGMEANTQHFNSTLDWWIARRTYFDRPPPALVRHTGWIFSLLLVWIVARLFGRNAGITRVAVVTAIEAIWTDLLQLPVLGVLSPSEEPIGPTATATATFCLFCGNFGILLISSSHWTMADALDILRRMIEVTMLRGAQSDGLVTFPQGIRSRVVNRKRTDLARLLVQQIDWDNQSFFFGGKTTTTTTPSSAVPRTYCGHTRFATSSKADLAGTHPHRWSGRASWRVFDLYTNRFGPVKVENFISHNGDFDFYILHGISYTLRF
jgi:hypothetical protein